jgi:hypothetical protein
MWRVFMSNPDERPVAPAQKSTPEAQTGYEAPRVEEVLTQEKLQQETLFAGRITPVEW